MRMLPAREAYARWAETYPPSAHNALMQAEQRALVRALRAAATMSGPAGATVFRALDAGSGSGRCAPILAATGAAVISADFSMPMLQRHGGDGRVCADARQLPFADGTFDMVNASLIAGDIADLGAWVAELARLLRPGGLLLYSDFHPAWSDYGWRRTFADAGGRECEIGRCEHSLDDHRLALTTAGLAGTVRELRVAMPMAGWWPKRGRKALVVVSARKAVR